MASRLPSTRQRRPSGAGSSREAKRTLGGPPFTRRRAFRGLGLKLAASTREHGERVNSSGRAISLAALSSLRDASEAVRARSDRFPQVAKRGPERVEVASASSRWSRSVERIRPAPRDDAARQGDPLLEAALGAACLGRPASVKGSKDLKRAGRGRADARRRYSESRDAPTPARTGGSILGCSRSGSKSMERRASGVALEADPCGREPNADRIVRLRFSRGSARSRSFS